MFPLGIPIDPPPEGFSYASLAQIAGIQIRKGDFCLSTHEIWQISAASQRNREGRELSKVVEML